MSEELAKTFFFHPPRCGCRPFEAGLLRDVPDGLAQHSQGPNAQRSISTTRSHSEHFLHDEEKKSSRGDGPLEERLAIYIIEARGMAGRRS